MPAGPGRGRSRCAGCGRRLPARPRRRSPAGDTFGTARSLGRLSQVWVADRRPEPGPGVDVSAGPCRMRQMTAGARIGAVADRPSVERALDVLAVGEGDLSHATLIRRIARELEDRHALSVAVHVVDEPRGLGRVLTRNVPGLGDADLQPLRWRLNYSRRAARFLRDGSATADVALVNTQSLALLARAPMRRLPTVLSLDCTGRQFAELEFWRKRGRLASLNDAPLFTLE